MAITMDIINFMKSKKFGEPFPIVGLVLNTLQFFIEFYPEISQGSTQHSD